MFSDHRGEPIHPQSVSQAFKRTANCADVPALTFHELGHTHATLLLKVRIPIKVVTERLGRSNPAYTMATYHHVLPAWMPKPPPPSNGSSKKPEGHRCDESPGRDGRRYGRNPGEERF